MPRSHWQLPDRWTRAEAARLAHLLEYRACVLATALHATGIAHPAEELELLTMQDAIARLRRAVAVEGRAAAEQLIEREEDRGTPA